MEQIKLMNEQGNVVGNIEKLEAHIHGKLHEAFSILIFDGKGNVLLQQRDLGKYHSGGLWANTCCSHVRADETLYEACKRCLTEEMGLECNLLPWFDFIYKAKVGAELVEYEYDHVFWGICKQTPTPAAEEVMDWRWTNLADLLDSVADSPNYAEWFKIICKIIKKSGYIKEQMIDEKEIFWGGVFDLT